MECEKAALSRKAVSLLKAKLCEKASSNHVFSAEWEYTIEKPKLEEIETDSKHSPNLDFLIEYLNELKNKVVTGAET